MFNSICYNINNQMLNHNSKVNIMSYSVADAITGRNLMEGQPVVGFIVQHQNDHYPLADNPNHAGIVPSHYFAIESLPIFGECGDCGAIEVSDELQLSVRLALQMTGTSTWAQLSDNGFSWHHGVQFMGRPDGPVTQGPRGINKRVYGLCLMHRETYDHLMTNGRSELADLYCCDGYPGEQRSPADREPDCRAVKALMGSCLQELPAVRQRYSDSRQVSAEKFVKFSALSRICSLNADGSHLQEISAGGEPHPLCHVLGNFDGALFGADFKELMRNSSFLGHALLKSAVPSVENLPDLDELLPQLWNCQHLKNRMYDVHAHFHPSLYAGQDANYPSILELSRATLQGAWAELVTRQVLGLGEDSPSRLDDELAKMEALASEMRSQLTKLRAK